MKERILGRLLHILNSGLGESFAWKAPPTDPHWNWKGGVLHSVPIPIHKGWGSHSFHRSIILGGVIDQDSLHQLWSSNFGRHPLPPFSGGLQVLIFSDNYGYCKDILNQVELGGLPKPRAISRPTWDRTVGGTVDHSGARGVVGRPSPLPLMRGGDVRNWHLLLMK